MNSRYQRMYRRTGRTPRPIVPPIGISLGNTARTLPEPQRDSLLRVILRELWRKFGV